MAQNKIKRFYIKSESKKSVAKGKVEKKPKNDTDIVKKTENLEKKASIQRGKLPCNWKSYISSNKSDGKTTNIVPKNLTSNKQDDQVAAKKPQKQLNNDTKSSNFTIPCIAIDCEMVGVGYKGKEDMLARVSLIDEFGKVVYDTFVKPMEKVTDYRTFVSGVRPNDMLNGRTFQQVQTDVNNIIKDKLLIGHAIKHDLKALLMKHPKKLIRDTSKYKKFKEICNGRTPGLKKLAEKVLGREIQTGEHSSVEDAKATMDLYLKFRNQIEYEMKSRKFKKYNPKVE